MVRVYENELEFNYITTTPRMLLNTTENDFPLFPVSRGKEFFGAEKHNASSRLRQLFGRNENFCLAN
jgi:hypothetical protein